MLETAVEVQDLDRRRVAQTGAQADIREVEQQVEIQEDLAGDEFGQR
jgi:hypothetical protein